MQNFPHLPQPCSICYPPHPGPQPNSCSPLDYKGRETLGTQPLKWEHCCFILNPFPPQNTDSRMEEEQTLGPESPKFETKLHQLLWVIYLTSLSHGFLHLQTKDNKTYFEGWRPNKVISVKHIQYMCVIFANMYLEPSCPFCMMTWPSKCEAQTVLEHRPHSRKSHENGSKIQDDWRTDQGALQRARFHRGLLGLTWQVRDNKYGLPQMWARARRMEKLILGLNSQVRPQRRGILQTGL